MFYSQDNSKQIFFLDYYILIKYDGSSNDPFFHIEKTFWYIEISFIRIKDMIKIYKMYRMYFYTNHIEVHSINDDNS